MAAASVREEILKSLQEKFETRLKEKMGIAASASELVPEQISQIEERYLSAFRDHLERGFDIAFREELIHNVDATASAEPLPSLSESLGAPTDEDLLLMDDSIVNAVHRRKVYPPKCTEYTEKYLKAKVDMAKNFQVDSELSAVPSLDPIEVSLSKGGIDRSAANTLREIGNLDERANRLAKVAAIRD